MTATAKRRIPDAAARGRTGALRRTQPPRVCIVTADITGPIRNGGIGTAYYSLARLLADAGHEVTVLYALGQHCEQESVAHWVRAFGGLGITFVPLPQPSGPELKGSIHVRTAWAVYAWLKGRDFDVVHFHEWRGLGYYALVGQRLGLCLQNALTVVGAHSPSLWHKAGMNDLPSSLDDVELDYLERGSVARADVLWSPSRHMLQWMQGHGWTLPSSRVVQQYVVRERAAPSPPATVPVDEFCFFGRLETRKGLDLFCAAMDLLARRGVRPGRVAFLGKGATVGGLDSLEYIEKRAGNWGIPFTIHTTLDRAAAMTYLQRPGRLAVLPSRLDNLPYTVLECLAARVPFVASTTGGIPEMLHPADRDRVLFGLRPEALATTLETSLVEGGRPARFRIAPAATDRGWLRLHAAWTHTARRHRTRLPRRRPRVSVCITHRNRPHLLRQALESIAAQDYAPFEVIVVDDGSDQPDALTDLKRSERTLARRGWRLLRQPNRFPGAARNAAASVARGEYLLFMDDDNYAKPGAIAAFVRAALTSDADVVTCFLDMFQGNERPPRGDAAHRWPFLGPSIAVGVARNCFGDTNCLVRARTWRELGGMTEDFGTGCEDWEFFARATLASARLEVLPEALAWYRQSSSGVQSTTNAVANRVRALRPYTAVWPAELHSVLPLCRDQGPSATQAPPIVVDHVRRVAIFGAGEGGRLASELVRRCGWELLYIVDNNATAWGSVVHGVPVRDPRVLLQRDVDLVIVASVSGKDALIRQLATMGFHYPNDVVFFLDPLCLRRVTMQVQL